jgi:hypothetical protein
MVPDAAGVVTATLDGGAAGAAAGAAAAGAVSCAATGTAHPPRIVPTKSIAPVRLPIIFVPEITRSRLLIEFSRANPAGRFSALPQPS